MTPLALRLVALSAAVLLLAPGVAVADEDWGDEGRNLDVDQTSDWFELRSDRAEGDVRDEVCLDLHTSNIRFDFELRESAASDVEASIRLELERVIEFRDENGDGAFQSSDDVRAEYDAGDLALASLASGPTSSGGVDGIEVTAAYNFTDHPGASLAFRATAFGNVTAHEGVLQRPVDVKLDILLTDFPYEEGDTLPAVELKVAAEAPRGPNVTAGEISFTSGDLTGIFSWKDTADVDGVERPVRTTVVRLPDEVEGDEVEATFSVTYAYARGAAIVHDPTFGFDLAPVAVVAALLGNWGFYALGAVLAAAVFTSLALARRGRKAKGK